MVIEIDKPITPPQKVQDALGNIQSRKGKKSLRDHFGKLKRGLDAVSYQKITDISIILI